MGAPLPPAPAPDFWWFERRSALRLALAILRAVATFRFVRLEAIPYDGERGRSLRFRVVTKGSEGMTRAATASTDVNESWPCPIWCPGGGGG